MTLDKPDNYKSTILITGCAGLLGSRLADMITKERPDITVVGLDDLSGGYIENVNPKEIQVLGSMLQHLWENNFNAVKVTF